VIMCALGRRETAVANSGNEHVRFYVTDGPPVTSASGAGANCFRECLHAGRGGVRVVLSDRDIELIAGSHYLEPGTQIRAEEVAYCGRLRPAVSTNWRLLDSAHRR
jgi:hypothetical protein